MAGCFGIAAGLIAVGLGMGVLGYRFLAGFTWIDALLNASMILTGMGPVGQLPDVGAKIFASLYALFSGLVFISVMALLVSPMKILPPTPQLPPTVLPCPTNAA